MTKKDYQKLGTALKEAREKAEFLETDKTYRGHYLYGVSVTTRLVIEALKKDNPRFNTAKFMNLVDGITV